MKNKFYTKSSPNRFNRWMLFTICFLLSLFTISESKAVGLTGTYTIPGSYATLALAITDLNTNGVSGPVIFNVSAAQTAPTGGYIIGGAGTALISGGAATTATNTVTINGIGLPVISSKLFARCFPRCLRSES